MAVETLLVLLFMVFAVPGACFLVLACTFIRGLWRGYRAQNIRRIEYRNWIELRAER